LRFFVLVSDRIEDDAADDAADDDDDVCYSGDSTVAGREYRGESFYARRQVERTSGDPAALLA